MLESVTLRTRNNFMISYKDFIDEEVEYQKHQQEKRRQEWPLRFLRFSLLLVIIGAIAYLGLIEMPFNSSTWKVQTSIPSAFRTSGRQRMATNLVRGDKLQKFSRKQVIDLLSKPDGSNTTSEVNYTIRLQCR